LLLLLQQMPANSCRSCRCHLEAQAQALQQQQLLLLFHVRKLAEAAAPKQVPVGLLLLPLLAAA
jgi:hypothetical protein